MGMINICNFKSIRFFFYKIEKFLWFLRFYGLLGVCGISNGKGKRD